MLKSFNREKTGKPQMELDQPELLSTIIKIMEATAATDNRRRSEILRTVKTLDDLSEKLVQMGLVRLPDHSFVVAQRHTLIPSVYGVCEVKPSGDVSYSGDTFIRIKSGRHDKSSAYTHVYDMRELFKCNLVERKPIMLLSTDGASDEAPRYPKPLASAVYFFKELELDVFLHGVNAAGLSSFNPVERRMSPLHMTLRASYFHTTPLELTWTATGRLLTKIWRRKTF